MKSLISHAVKAVVVVLLLMSVGAYAQNTSIGLSVADGAGKPLAINPPVEGSYLWAAQRIDTLDGQGQILIEHDLSEPGLFTFDYQRRNYCLYVRPGEKYEIRIDAKDAVKPLQVISGSFPEGQEALGRLSYGYGREPREAEVYSKQDPEFENIHQKVLDTVDKQLAVFENLYEKGQIDKGFFETAALLIKNRYASVLVEALLNIGLYDGIIYHPDSAGYDRAVIDRFGRYWTAIFSLVEMGNLSAARVPTYFDYYDRANHWYYGVFLPRSEGRFPPPGRRTTDDYWQELYELINEYHSAGPLQEYLLASQIHSIASFQRYQAFLIDMFTDFVEAYPNSIYIPYLEPAMDKVYAFHAKKQAAEPDSYRFIKDAASFSSFDELARHFPDQLVYIDIWATWCVPCQREFAYSAGLKEFAALKNITLLYISIDRADVEDRWKQMIGYYDLKGHHIRASDSLLADLRQRFGSGSTLGIPRYILVKNGKVVAGHALRPSDGEALYAQIQAFY